MIRSTLAALAVVTVCAFVLPTSFVGVAQAWTVGDGCGEDGGGSGAGTDFAAAACPDGPSSEEPGHGTGGDGPDLPALTDDEKVTLMEQSCNAALRNLTRIPPSMVTDFAAENGVVIVGVCNSGVGHKVAIDPSQALPLQAAIAGNPVLSAALQARGYSADDVVGVVIIDGAATLYIHKGA